MDIKKLVKPNIRSLHAYEAEELSCRIKLDANESPYGFKALRSIKTNRYPDPKASSLRKLVAGEFKIKPENILHGNGSDELIYYLITTFGGPVLYPVPTFSMYGIISQALGEKRIEIPLDRNFDLNTDEFYKTIRKGNPKLIFLSSPNNPTGNSFSSGRILKIIQSTSLRVTRHPSLVVVDEAYQPFSNKKSFVPLLKKYKNLAILRTLSKVGLAGLRVGFMIADPAIIKEVNKVRLPFNLNSVSQAIAVEALRKRKLLRKYIASIISERERLFNGMNKMKNIKIYQSDANFILFKLKNSDKIYKALLKKGVLVKNMKGRVNSCLRVTVGTPVENRIFLKTLKLLI